MHLGLLSQGSGGALDNIRLHLCWDQVRVNKAHTSSNFRYEKKSDGDRGGTMTTVRIWDVVQGPMEVIIEKY